MVTQVTPAVAQIASQAEAEAGTATDKFMTPQRVQQAIAALEASAFPRGFINGLHIAHDGVDTDHDIVIGIGACRDKDNTGNLELTALLTKQIDAAWAAGDDAGGLASALTLTAGTWYHVFVVDDGAGGTDAGFDTSDTAANLLSDSGGTMYRHVGWVLTDGSENIYDFNRNGDHYMWRNAALTADSWSASTTAANVTVNVPPNHLGLFNIHWATIGGSATSVYGLLQHPDDTQAPSSTKFNYSCNRQAAAVVASSSFAMVKANASSQVRHDEDVATGTVLLMTSGFLDPREVN